MVINLGQLKEVAEREIMTRFDHKDLNHDTDYFIHIPPTPEHFASLIFKLLDEGLAGRVARPSPPPPIFGSFSWMSFGGLHDLPHPPLQSRLLRMYSPSPRFPPKRTKKFSESVRIRLAMDMTMLSEVSVTGPHRLGDRADHRPGAAR